MNLSFNLSDPMFFPFFRHAFVYRTLATIVLEPAAACPVLPDVSSLQPVTASLSTQSFAFSFSAMLFPCLIDFGLLYGIVKKHVRLIFFIPLAVTIQWLLCLLSSAPACPVSY